MIITSTAQQRGHAARSIPRQQALIGSCGEQAMLRMAACAGWQATLCGTRKMMLWELGRRAHLHAGVHVGLSQGAAVDALGADAAVEGPLRRWVASVGPPVHMPALAQHGVLLPASHAPLQHGSFRKDWEVHPLQDASGQQTRAGMPSSTSMLSTRPCQLILISAVLSSTGCGFSSLRTKECRLW